MSLFSSSPLTRVRELLSALVILNGALLSPWAAAQPGDEVTTIEIDESVAQCLLNEVLKGANDARTARELRLLCGAEAAPVETRGAPAPTILLSRTLDNSYFRPYKDNYILFGSMRNRDGSIPFSGNRTDIKFELGMQFSAFPQGREDSRLAALQFGYSQRSWWDIAESSAPFKEHNYNPEIFWDFTKALAKPSPKPRLHLVDQAGYEHQSNGLDSLNSRSWDRLYVQREFRLSEMFSWSVKLWNVVNLGDYNADIEDYIGNAEITTHVDLNNWVNLDIKAIKGHKIEKISYQVDLSVPMSQWVNSRFFISYYEGYGEALISYNKYTKSVRAGFYFPLGF